jgi:hypothetical protein
MFWGSTGGARDATKRKQATQRDKTKRKQPTQAGAGKQAPSQQKGRRIRVCTSERGREAHRRHGQKQNLQKTSALQPRDAPIIAAMNPMYPAESARPPSGGEAREAGREAGERARESAPKSGREPRCEGEHERVSARAGE